MQELSQQENQQKMKSKNTSEDFEMKDEYDFTNGIMKPPRIKSPKDFNIPIYLEEDLREYFFGYTKENKLDETKYINGLLRKIKDKKEKRQKCLQ